MVAVSVYQNIVFHKIGFEMMSHFQIKAFRQNFNAQLGVFSGKYGIAR
jgi:hypothetical protein